MQVFRKLFAMLGAVTVVVAASACGDGGADLESTGSGVKVVATTTQIGALVREVAGDGVELTVLLKAGADAHDYDPSPQAAKKVSEAQLVLKNGIGLDDWLDDMVEGAGAEDRVVVVTEGIEIREGADEDEHGDAHDEDPHVWHNPQFAKLMVDNIVAGLSTADPGQAAIFAQRGEAYRAKLDETEAEIRRLIDEIPQENRKVVTNHDAFGYFLDHFGLEFAGAVIPSTNKDAQASAKELAELHDLVKSEAVKAIFAEEEVDPKVARELAADTGTTIVTGLYADSLGPVGSGAETIHGMLLFNARKFAEALR